MVFRSTGSYEPDPFFQSAHQGTSMFRSTGSYEPDLVTDDQGALQLAVSIHRLLRA